MTLTKEQIAEGRELLPCPWCGSGEHLSFQQVGSLTADMPDRPYRVICTHIDHDTVTGPTAYGEIAAAVAWNTRAVVAEAKGEPVAWLYCIPDGERWVREHRDINFSPDGWMAQAGWTETPLYTHPAPERPTDVGDVERVASELFPENGNRCESDARRIARLPDLEAAFLEAVELLRELRETNEPTGLEGLRVGHKTDAFLEKLK